MRSTTPYTGVAICQIAVSFDEPRMSVPGYERTFSHLIIYVRFPPESGRFSGLTIMSGFDPKQTFPSFH